jgi:lysozyme family protein
MASAFEQAFAFTLGNEGKFVNAKNDKGGATKYGITIATLSRWLGRPASVLEVQNLTLEVAEAIYNKWYWDALGCDAITHTGVAMAMFDIGVVRGIGIPPVYAQSICVAHGIPLVQDGHLGPKSLAAINSISQAGFVRDFSVKTEAGFRAIVAKDPSQQKFLKGWVNRAHHLLTLASVPDVVSAKQILAKMSTPVCRLVQTAA